MIVVGIDPGKKGGVCAFGEHKVYAGGKYVMQRVNRAQLMPEYASDLADLLYDVGAAVAYVENVHAMPGQGVTSMFNFGKGFGEVLGVCAALDICVELVSPQKWKRAVLGGTAKDKAAAIEFAQREYPMIDLVPGRCRMPQDGIADAVCIAHYGVMMETNK